MHGFYRANLTVFAAILVALSCCLPLLFSNGTAKAAGPKKPAISVSKPQGDAVDARLKKSGLVNLKDLGENFVFDQRYATDDNFTGQKIYGSTRVYLRPGTAEKLAAANREFNALGYRIKIWDAYRPMSVQYLLYDKAPEGLKYFIADPRNTDGCTHNRGGAVDVTLVKLDGSPVEMPTDFDVFDYEADIHDDNVSPAAARDRALLRDVMQKHGFTGIDCEWWHFNDSDVWKYAILDVTF